MGHGWPRVDLGDGRQDDGEDRRPRRDAWLAMHQQFNTQTMMAWDNACARARYEADRAYEKEYPA